MTLSVSLVHSLLAGLAQRGEPCERWLQAAGISADQLASPEGRVTHAQYGTLVRTLVEERNDEAFGLLPRPARIGVFALQARCAIGAPTLEVAIRRIAHVFRLQHEGIELRLQRDGHLAGVALCVTGADVPPAPFRDQLILRAYWLLLAWLLGGKLPVVRCDFAFPAEAEGYLQILPTPWRFDAPVSAFWFEASWLKRPPCRHEAELRSYLPDVLNQLLAPSRDGAVSGRVRAYLEQVRPAWPDVDGVARAMNMSVSSLQRRLSTEGASFQKIKDELRRDIAIFRINTSDVPLERLAAELGFSDSSTFHRAFKVWTGCSPGVYRRIGRG
ncbi:MAG: AraC family transcriptional regulator ligand-binding domain-containing protein [Rubrivivax sp.]|nr:AraC family transcriptional regulator ligand-binding domain-containing protein [Rubrivivax sp.]